MISRLTVAAVLVAAVAAGCGSSGSAATTARVGSATTAAGAPAHTIDPNFDFGQTVLITPAGMHPKWLVSLVGVPIVWHNDTDRVQSIVFDHQPVHSPPIPPGGTFTYRPPTAISMSYHSGHGRHLHAVVQVTPAAQ